MISKSPCRPLSLGATAGACLVALLPALPAWGVKVCTYNTLFWPEDYLTRAPHFETVLAELVPDVIVLQEVESQTGVNRFLFDVLVHSQVPGDAVARMVGFSLACLLGLAALAGAAAWALGWPRSLSSAVVLVVLLFAGAALLSVPFAYWRGHAIESYYEILKIKMGSDDDRQILEAVRDVTDRPLRVDANEGWNLDDAVEKLEWLQAMGVELVEQPLPAGELEAMRELRRSSPLPLFADESIHRAIDIPELAQRNLAALLPQDARGVVMLSFSRDSGLITITRQGAIYLSRTLDVGLEQLQPGALLSELLDRIVLEVQRSLDYYDSYFRLASVVDLVVAPLPAEIPGLLEHLNANLSVTATAMEPEQVLDFEVPVPPDRLYECLWTLGAALRQEEAAP